MIRLRYGDTGISGLQSMYLAAGRKRSIFLGRRSCAAGRAAPKPSKSEAQMSEHSCSRRELLRNASLAVALLTLPRSVWATSDASLAREHLQVALRAERWIRRSRIQSRRGVTWPADPLE